MSPKSILKAKYRVLVIQLTLIGREYSLFLPVDGVCFDFNRCYAKLTNFGKRLMIF